mgnify:FL=1
MTLEGKYNIVVHKLNRRAPIVAIKLEDFCEIIEMLKKNKVL